MTEEEMDALEQKIWLTFLESATPLEIHKSVATSNWDGNDFLLNWLKDNPKSDKGTVLMAYWYSGPRYKKQYVNREDCQKRDSWLLDDFDFVEDLEKKYTGGFYTNETIFFDPKHGVEGDDWTSDYLDVHVVRDIPDIMFQPTDGDIKLDEHPEDFDEGLPMTPINYAQQIYDLYDKYEIDD